MSQSSLVQRLIAFLKRPDALQHDRRTPVHNPYDDYTPHPVAAVPAPKPHLHEAAVATPAPTYDPSQRAPMVQTDDRSPSHASRLDALLVRALQQFNAQQGYVIRSDRDGRMRYCTGRDAQGRYIPHTGADPDRRAVFLALDSGESQLFVYTNDENIPVAVLCGPLWANEEIIGVLYIDNPARGRLHRGIFDVFCDQAARMLSEGIG